MIELEDITDKNWRSKLSVSSSQKKYVAYQVTLLARAYAYKNQNSYACIIRANQIPVGMALYYDCPERINLLGTEKIIRTWKGGNSHVKYEKNRTNSPL